jgi:cytochrome c-type biogenesis protein CcmH/NrfF
MSSRATLAAALLVACLGAGVTLAAPEETPGQTCVGGASAPAAAGLSAFERADVRAIAERVTCYCGCPHLQVSKCFCGTADEIRADIATKLDRGDTPEAIIAAYVSEHGEGILAVPPRVGFHWIIWLLPPAVLVVGVTGLILAGRRWRRPEVVGARSPPSPLQARLREDLRRTVEDGS